MSHTSQILRLICLALLMCCSLATAGKITVVSSTTAEILDSAYATATECRILAKFDFPDSLSGAIIDFARLRFEVSDVEELEDGYLLRTFQLATNWSPGTVTWTNPWDSAGGDLADAKALRTVVPSRSRNGILDISGIVQAWASDTSSNYGIIAFPLSCKNKDFNFDDVSGSDMFQLEIYFRKE